MLLLAVRKKIEEKPRKEKPPSGDTILSDRQMERHLLIFEEFSLMS